VIVAVASSKARTDQDDRQLDAGADDIPFSVSFFLSLSPFFSFSQERQFSDSGE
jgi:hypothetical protein